MWASRGGKIHGVSVNIVTFEFPVIGRLHGRFLHIPVTTRGLLSMCGKKSLAWGHRGMHDKLSAPMICKTCAASFRRRYRDGGPLP